MKCAACPIAHLSRPCWSEANRTPAACDLIAAGVPGAPDIVLRDAGLAPPLEPAQTHGSPAPVPKAVSFAVVTCPARGIPVECGCALEHRYCGETLDLVTWDACVACRRAAQESAPARESHPTDPGVPN